MKVKWLHCLAAAIVVLALLAGCAAPTPTIAPTKPAVAAPTAAPIQPAATAKPAAVATAAPAAQPTTAPVAKIKRGGTLIMSQGSSPSTLDPVLTTNSGPTIEPPIFEALLRWDLKDEKTGAHDFGPELAESWKIENPTTVTLKLQKGVKFHDGSEWNAELAKWNIERVMNHPKSMGKQLVSSIKNIEIMDPFTIKLNLAQPSATILHSLTRATGGTGSSASLIVSKAAIDKGEDAFGAKPVGSGPQQVVEWKRDDRLLMKKWEGYWKKGADGQQLPYVDAVTSRYIVDKAVALVELKAGSVQVAATIDGKDIAGVRSNPDLVFVAEPWASEFMVIGLNPAKDIFKNQKTRQAMQYAIDRQAATQALGFGVGMPQYYPTWNSSYPGYDESIFKYEYNLDKATALLKEAGQENGIDFSFMCMANPFQQRIMEVVQAMWQKAKIRTKLDSFETVAWRSKMKANEFDVGLWGMSPSPDPDMYTRWLVCNRPSNWSNYCNPEVDKCLLEAGSKYDAKERGDIYKRCIKMINEDAYVGGVFMMPVNIVYRKEIKGVRIQGWAMDLQEAWIDK